MQIIFLGHSESIGTYVIVGTINYEHFTMACLALHKKRFRTLKFVQEYISEIGPSVAVETFVGWKTFGKVKITELSHQFDFYTWDYILLFLVLKQVLGSQVLNMSKRQRAMNSRVTLCPTRGKSTKPSMVKESRSTSTIGSATVSTQSFSVPRTG